MPDPSRNEQVVPCLQCHRINVAVELTGYALLEFVARYVHPDVSVERHEQLISAEVPVKANLLGGRNCEYAHRTALGRDEDIRRSPWALECPDRSGVYSIVESASDGIGQELGAPGEGNIGPTRNPGVYEPVQPPFAIVRPIGQTLRCYQDSRHDIDLGES